MSKTTKITVAGIIAFALIAAAVAVKMIFFPSLSDKYFQVNATALKRAPAGLAVVRPTHFASLGRSSPPGITQARINDVTWMVGRNIPFKRLLGMAYPSQVGRIMLPPDAPKGGFDFLVTGPNDPQESLQSAIRKLGYSAKTETRDTDVLAFKVENAGLPGMTVSTAGREDASLKGGRLCFTHMQMSMLAQGLESTLQMPVLDQTGLTNFYDFSVAWDMKMQRQLRDSSTARDAVEKILNGLGLGLEPDTAPLEMLVVKKTK